MKKREEKGFKVKPKICVSYQTWTTINEQNIFAFTDIVFSFSESWNPTSYFEAIENELNKYITLKFFIAFWNFKIT